MRKGQASKRAVQLSPDKLGVSEWQRDFWLALIEHAQSGKPGLPDLSRLEGFNNPALIRHAVTTPDLQHGFDKYSAGKPYHRQVRPFGFMVMFQQEELAEISDRAGSVQRSRQRPPTALRIIAPFNRDPASAARHAFDRDTGTPVPAKQLKTYARALRHYHDHPEAKFLNGERAERGPTMRRHVMVRSVRHIGKEANKLDNQMAFGIDPSAQAEFGDGGSGLQQRVEAIKIAVEKFGPVKVARKADISRQHLHAIINGSKASVENMVRIEQAVHAVQSVQYADVAGAFGAIDKIKTLVQRIGVRKAAATLKIDAGQLSRILSGGPAVSERLRRRIDEQLQEGAVSVPQKSDI
jgi:hypothetical protein